MSGSKLSDAHDKPSPLDLTVHSLPSPQGHEDGRRVVGRWKMLLVLLVCAAPVVASYFTYYVIRPEGRRNFGELIDPQPVLPDVQATAMDGSSVNLRSLKGQWLLVVVAGGACDALCEQQLYLQRQLREVLGKEKDRLDRVWLLSDEAPVPEALRPGLQGATVLRLPPDALNNFLKPAAGQALQDHLYVVDPMGNWMMRFPAKLDLSTASKAKTDLERVLRASKSWDPAGR
jgi:hypothetical protein